MEKNKEWNDICKAIEKWTEKHNFNATFVGSFIAFDKKGDIKFDRMIACGKKDLIEIQIDSLKQEAKKEKDFISW